MTNKKLATLRFAPDAAPCVVECVRYNKPDGNAWGIGVVPPRYNTLRMVIMRDVRDPISNYIDLLRAVAATHGFDPDGPGFISPDKAWGVGWVVNTVTFETELGKE